MPTSRVKTNLFLNFETAQNGKMWVTHDDPIG